MTITPGATRRRRRARAGIVRGGTRIVLLLLLAVFFGVPLVRPYVIYMLILTFASNVQLFVEPQLLARAPGASIGKYWSLNQLGYAYAFELSDFGKSAAISLLMLAIGLVGAILVIRLTDFFRADVGER